MTTQDTITNISAVMNVEDSLDERGGLPSASHFEIDVECPGNRAMVSRIPKRELEKLRSPKDDEFAERGNRIHRARELLSEDGLENEDEIASYRNGVEIERLLIEKWMEDKGLAVSDIREGPREERLWLHDRNLEIIASGKPDVQYISGPYAFVIDKKTGYCTNIPPSPRSWQLRMQALLIREHRQGVQEVRVAYEKDMLRPSLATSDYTDYNEQDLDYALQDAEFRLWLARQPDSPRHPGTWCRWCPAKAWCKEAGAWSLLPSVDMEPSGKVSPLPPDAAEMVSRLTPTDLVKLWRNKPLVEKVLEEAIKRLKGLDDKTLMDLGLERTAGRRLDPIVNVEGAFDFLLSKGWDKATIFKCMSISKGAVGEQIGLREGINKKYQSQRVAEDLAEFIEKKNAEPGLKQSKGIQ